MFEAPMALTKIISKYQRVKKIPLAGSSRWVVIVKLWSLVLSILKSRIITHARVIDNINPFQPLKTPEMYCKGQIPIITSNKEWLLWVSTGKHYISLFTFCTPFALQFPCYQAKSSEIIIYIKMGMAPQNITQTLNSLSSPTK